MRLAARTVVALMGCAAVLHGPSSAGTPIARSESKAVTAFTTMGGRIAEVLVKRGDRVVAGQPLLRFAESTIDRHLVRARAILASGAIPDATSIVARVSPATWNQLIRTDPQSLAAEQEYVDALVAFEKSHSEAARQRLTDAVRARQRSIRRMGRMTPALLDSVQRLSGETAEILRWLDSQRASLGASSPVDGIVELFDLHPGDTLEAMSPVALIATERRP